MRRVEQTISIKTVLLSLGFLLAFSNTSYGLGLVKVNQTAGKGKCLPQMKGSVSSILKKNKIRVFTGNNKMPSKKNPQGVTNRKRLSYSDGRARAVAEVVYAVTSIGNKKFKAHKNVSIVFGNSGKSSKNSRRTAYDLQLNPGGQNKKGVGSSKFGGTHNRALIAHELGHYVGRTHYNKYYKAVRNTCMLTGYSKRNKRNGRNEEFAEVFAAYITNPALFKGKGRNCDKAFKYFAKAFGESRIRKTCASRKGSSGKSQTVKTVKSKKLKDYKLSELPTPTLNPRKKAKKAVVKDVEKREEVFLIIKNEAIPTPNPRKKVSQNDLTFDAASVLKRMEHLEDIEVIDEVDEDGEPLPVSVSGLIHHHSDLDDESINGEAASIKEYETYIQGHSHSH